MAITFTNLGVSTGTTPQAPDIRNVGDATSYTIPSWDPPDDGIVVLCILNGENAGNSFLDSVTGNGDVWEFIADLSYPTGTETRQMNVVAAYGADLTTGATLIDFAGVTQINCYVSIFHITGADESGLVVDAFALPAVTGDGTSTTVTIDFPTPLDADNRAFAFVAHNANEVVSIDAGSTTWTKLDDMNGAGPALGMITAFDTAAGPNDPNFDWTTSAAYGFIGIEVKIAPTGGAGSYTVVNGSDEQLVNINAGGTDVDARSFKNGVSLTSTELAALLANFGQKGVAVMADLTGDVLAEQRRKATFDIRLPSS